MLDLVQFILNWPAQTSEPAPVDAATVPPALVSDDPGAQVSEVADPALSTIGPASASSASS